MHTMDKKNRNPVIRVEEETRRLLKIIAAQVGETMQETVKRLAQAERERLRKQEQKTDAQDV
jgi:hypothetical protein